MKAGPNEWPSTATAYDGITRATKNASSSSLAPNIWATCQSLANAISLTSTVIAPSMAALASSGRSGAPAALADLGSTGADSNIEGPAEAEWDIHSALPRWKMPGKSRSVSPAIVVVECRHSPDHPLPQRDFRRKGRALTLRGKVPAAIFPPPIGVNYALHRVWRAVIEGFSTDPVLIAVCALAASALVAARDMPLSLGLALATIRVGVAFVYFAVYYDMVWNVGDDLVYFAHACELADSGYNPLTVLAYADGWQNL